MATMAEKQAQLTKLFVWSLKTYRKQYGKVFLDDCQTALEDAWDSVFDIKDPDEDIPF